MSISKLETITPAKAKEYLATRARNRALRERDVIKYALDMEAGSWVDNGESIKFDAAGHLIDGQHRLEACVLAEKAFTTTVVRDIVDDRAMATIDVGATRTHADVFTIAGHKNAFALSSIALMVCMVERGRVTWTAYGTERLRRGNSPLAKRLKAMPNAASAISKEELKTWAEPYIPELAVAADQAKRCGGSPIFGVQALGALFYLAAKKDPIAARQFLNDVSKGIGLQQNDPAYTVREHIISRQAKGGVRIARQYVLGVLIKAWNARRDSRPMRVVRVGEGEPFPKVK